jgi:hypothetical protein
MRKEGVTIRKERARELLNSYDVGEIVNKNDEKILIDLFSNHHPNWEKKSENMLHFYVDDEKNYGTKCFWIWKKDNTYIDISINTCNSSATSNIISTVKTAFRNAVFGEVEKEKMKHLHHENITFQELVDRWMSGSKLTYEVLYKYVRSEGTTTYFIRDDLKESWIKYHNKYAILEELTPEEHKLKHKSKNDKNL